MNPLSYVLLEIVNVCRKGYWTYDVALRHTGKDSYKIRCLAIHHYALLPIVKEGFNPLQSVASNTLILQFIKTSVVRNLIKGLRKVQYVDISQLSM